VNSVAPDNPGSFHETAISESPGGGLVGWIRAHKIKTLLILLLAFAGVELATIPFFGVAALKEENPVLSALMEQRVDEAEQEGKTLRIRQQWVPLSRISRHLVNAVIVAEDGTFYAHNGFDWFEVQESIQKNIAKRRAARGASTITQQLAKNLFLSTSKDPIRKLKEAIITLLLENSLSKNRILEIYLNVIEWGRGVFGVEAAARAYFGKSAAHLTLEEATRLAAVIPSPLRYRPDGDTRYVLRRKEIVLRRMAARNFTGSPTAQETLPTPDVDLSLMFDDSLDLILPEDTLGPARSVDTVKAAITRDTSKEVQTGDTSGLNMPTDTADAEEGNNGL
jgi:monofunctional biosynthetic peptidoglycan transglycosylase